MKTGDLVICKREDSYLIDFLEMCICPKVNEIVEIENITVDEDGSWLSLVGYDEIVYDASCFRKLELKDVAKEMVIHELIS
jgi:hypothetical protein